MYLMYLGKLLLPVTPSSISISGKNKNQSITLINEGEINVLKKGGLDTIKFDALLPNVEYPFATYNGGFRSADYFLEQLEKMKKAKKPFQYILTREKPDGNTLKSTNIKVSLETFPWKEDSKNGLDIIVSIELKKYKNYGLKTYQIETQNDTEVVAMSDTQRTTENSPLPVQTTTYPVKSGDSLYAIAKYFYGNGAKYTDIFEANKDKISNPSLIYPGQVLTIPCIT